MKIKNTLPKLAAILFLIIGFASCEEDFSTIGTNIIGDQNINATLYESNSVISYSRKLNGVQTNGLSTYQLGVYNDPVYGKSTVNLLTQVFLDDTAPVFGTNPVLDSVVLYMPFYSEETVDGDVTTFELDSVYGSNPINITVYESNYFLRDLDPDTGFQEEQKYYSNQGPLFESYLIDSQEGLITLINDFVPSNEGIVTLVEDGDDEGDEPDEVVLAPGLRVKLPLDFFLQKIMAQEGTVSLINNNNFREYFRGIYFDVEGNSGDNLFLFDLEESKITMYYQSEITYTDEDGNVITENSPGDLGISLGPVAVNVYENSLPGPIESALSEPNTVEGEENLYVRGGEGIVSIIELFGEDLDDNGVADELETLRDQKWLVNEANLIFYVDQSMIAGGDSEPERLIIYDAQNSNALVDYSLDITAGLSPYEALNEHLGILERGTDEIGDYYKIKITHHISNLINKDSTNVPLGLIVSQNVTTPDFQSLEEMLDPGVESVPASGVISHQGTILHGNNSPNPEKRLKLQIYYTEPN
tara:strand:- start:1871 stop:3460 length:1590 start_codon:yes stop_codon:yes gene_type:complete